jgi:hypothetical protein
VSAIGRRRVLRELVARIEGQPRPLQLEHDMVVAFLVTVRREAEAVTIESDRSPDVSHAERDEADLGFSY